ncbi:hypothetical protein AB0F88_28020 [Streptosporangium sp. NPDC023963]|uniref:hypothetical protein n=1 Tax=Streptosporangium sp. NPDC023963 TaxID=3155608 RepID=UPI0034381B93
MPLRAGGAGPDRPKSRSRANWPTGARAGRAAVCARDADKLKCLIQAIEYREQGHQNIQLWIDSSLAALKTASAKRLADEALSTGSLEWMTRVLNGD